MNTLKPNNDHYYVIAIWFALLAVLFFATSCGARKPVVVKEIVTETITEQLHDTIFITEPDSSLLQALIECRNGQPIIKEIIKEIPGKTISETPRVSIKDSILTVDCEARAQELFAEWKSTHSTTTIEKITEVPVPYTPGIVKALAWIGGIAVGLFIIGLIIKLFKR